MAAMPFAGKPHRGQRPFLQTTIFLWQRTIMLFYREHVARSCGITYAACKRSTVTMSLRQFLARRETGFLSAEDTPRALNFSFSSIC